MTECTFVAYLVKVGERGPADVALVRGLAVPFDPEAVNLDLVGG